MASKYHGTSNKPSKMPMKGMPPKGMPKSMPSKKGC